MVAACIERYGSCDVLVNNAATNPYAGPLIEAPLSAWDKTVEVNLRGPLAWSQIAWQAWMKDHDGCSIINIASVGGFKTSPELGLYGVLKAGARPHDQAAGRRAGAERAGERHRARPSSAPTSPASSGRASGASARPRPYPLKRLGEPEDIGEAALYLTAGATWMTGQTLVLDGGGLIAFGDESQEE